MRKTNDMVQVPYSTMYLPRIYLTQNEIKRAFDGWITLGTLKIYVINFKDVQTYYDTHKHIGHKTNSRQKFITQHMNDSEIQKDVKLFSAGSIDLIDLSVKYGIYYKDIRKVFNACLPNTDVDTLWKKHKKHVQKRTDLKLYGYVNSALDPTVQAKKDETMMKRYGSTNIMKTKQGVQKVQQTMRARYGVNFAFTAKHKQAVLNFRTRIFDHLNIDKSWHKTFKYLAEKYNCDVSVQIFSDSNLNIHNRDFILTMQMTDSVEQLLKAYKYSNNACIQYPNDIFFNLFDKTEQYPFSKSWLRKYHDKTLVTVDDSSLIGGSSKYETLIINFLKSYNIKFEINKRTILNGHEIDFYFPNHKIGLEISPSPTHNSNQFAYSSRRVIYNDKKQIKSRTYHYTKYQEAKKCGITLLQWFSTDLAEPQLSTISLPRLLNLLGKQRHKVYARNVNLELSQNRKKSRTFIHTYHSQDVGRANEYWNFIYDDELIASASFVINGLSAELKRLCFKPDIQIVGGISKLINHFFKEHPQINKIISFSDNNLGNGLSYQKAGAILDHETGPSLRYISWSDPTDSYSWSISASWSVNHPNGIIYKATNGKKFKSKDDIEKYIELKLPHRTDTKTGYDRIYTAGSKKWIFSRTTFFK